jgi:hypothetical protein
MARAAYSKRRYLCQSMELSAMLKVISLVSFCFVFYPAVQANNCDTVESLTWLFVHSVHLF